MSTAVKQQGFSLVEIMVAMTLSLILIAGALSVLYSSKVTYAENERIAGLQQSGRGALELMLRDLRAGGFKGCTRQPRGFDNMLVNPSAFLWRFDEPVYGFENTGTNTWTPAVDASIISPADGSDILAIRSTSADLPVFTLSADMASKVASPLNVAMVAGDRIDAGQTLVISNCERATIFAATSFDPTGATADIDTGGTDLQEAFVAGTRIVPIDTITYYIRPSLTLRNGVANPSLWRKVGNTPPEELVEGIEQMQVTYGVSNGVAPEVIDYIKASAVTNWTRVKSVSIALLIRSVEPNSSMPDSKTYTLLDQAAVGPFNDRYQRSLYTTTVLLRNN